MRALDAIVEDTTVPRNPEKDEQLLELSSANKCREVIEGSVLMILINSAGELNCWLSVCLEIYKESSSFTRSYPKM